MYFITFNMHGEITAETTIQEALIARRASKYIQRCWYKPTRQKVETTLPHIYFKNVREYINSEVKFDNSSAFGLLHIYLQKPSHLIQQLAFHSKSSNQHR